MNIVRRNATAGDVPPLTPVEFEILLSLADRDRHGYAIIQDVAHRSHGDVTIRPGTLYRAISRLLQAELILEVDGPSPRRGGTDNERRRYYSLTPLGRRAAAAEAGRLARQVTIARSRKLLKSEG